MENEITEESKEIQKKLLEFGKVRLKVQKALESNVRVPTELLHELKDAINSLKPFKQIPFRPFPEFKEILEWIDWEEKNGQERGEMEIPYSARIQRLHHLKKPKINPTLNNEVEEFDFSYRLWNPRFTRWFYPSGAIHDYHYGESFGKLVLDRYHGPKIIANLNDDFTTYDSYLGVTWDHQYYHGHSKMTGSFTSSFEIPSGFHTLMVRSEINTAVVATMAPSRIGRDWVTLTANHRFYVRLPLGPNNPWLGIRSMEKRWWVFESDGGVFREYPSISPSICDIIMNALGPGIVTVVETIRYDLGFTGKVQSAVADGLASVWEPIRWGIL